MIDGLTNIEEIFYKTHSAFIFKRMHNYEINILVEPFLQYNVLFLSQ